MVKNRRQGFVAVIVMLCLAIASVIVLDWMRGAVRDRKQLRAEEQRIQADWLAQAGLERAAARLAANPEYGGETWNIGADKLSGRDGAAVVIHVAAVAERPQDRQIEVEAAYPADPLMRALRSRRLVVHVGQNKP